MVEFRARRGAMGEIMRSRQVAVLLTRVAQPIAARVRANTPRDTGGTAASTTVDPPSLAPVGDRVQVRIAQDAATGQDRPRGAAAAPLQFGNARTVQRAHMTRALGSP